MISIDIPGGTLEFIYPGETSGYVVAAFIAADDDFGLTEMMLYGPFTGADAEEKAQAFGQTHIASDVAWRAIPMQTTAQHARLDRLRYAVTHRSDPWFRVSWTRLDVAAFFSAHDEEVSVSEAELLLETLVDMAVMRPGIRPGVWNPRLTAIAEAEGA